MSEEQQLFKSSMQGFKDVLDFALRVSVALSGLPTDQPGEFSSAVHMKMCIHGSSVLELSEADFLDHSALLSLSRMLIEGMTMYYYIRQPVSAEEWQCRYLILKLHDTVGRIKFMRATQPKEQYEDLTHGRDNLKNLLNANPIFAAMIEKQREECFTGQRMFYRGTQAAVKYAGWDWDRYLSFYNYLSAHSHLAPMSFFRLRSHQVGFMKPSNEQLGIASFGISLAGFCLLRTSLHILAAHPEQEGKFNPAELARYREEIKKSTVLKGAQAEQAANAASPT